MTFTYRAIYNNHECQLLDINNHKCKIDTLFYSQQGVSLFITDTLSTSNIHIKRRSNLRGGDEMVSCNTLIATCKSEKHFFHRIVSVSSSEKTRNLGKSSISFRAYPSVWQKSIVVLIDEILRWWRGQTTSFGWLHM